MHAGPVGTVEKWIDRAASAVFALACAFAAYFYSAPTLRHPLVAAETAAVAALGYFLSLLVLRAVRPGPRKLAIPIFDLRDVDLPESPVVRLTDLLDQENEHRPEPPPESQDEAKEPLMLDDILAELGPNSRVVRLFDPVAMPTAGELKSRIDRHLDRETSATQYPDAAQALHDALAELRRSIR